MVRIRGIQFSDDCELAVSVNGQENILTPAKKDALNVAINFIKLCNLDQMHQSDATIALSYYRSTVLAEGNAILAHKMTKQDYQIKKLVISPETFQYSVMYTFDGVDGHNVTIMHKLTGQRDASKPTMS